MLADALLYTDERLGPTGSLHAAGLLDGRAYYERSDDGGATKVAFADASTRKAVDPDLVDGDAPTVTECFPGTILVAATQGGKVRTWASHDAGEHWAVLGSVE